MSEVVSAVSMASTLDEDAVERNRSNSPSQEHIRDSNRTREVRSVDVDGERVHQRTWAGMPSDDAIIDTEVTEMNQYLNTKHRGGKWRNPSGPGNIPVWNDAWTCPHSGKEFQHLTDDYITAAAKKDGVQSWSSFLRGNEDVMEKLRDQHDPARTHKAPDLSRDGVYDRLKKDNDDMNDELQEMKGMVGTLLDEINKLKASGDAPKKRGRPAKVKPDNES